MRLLLDTHALLWLITDPDRFPIATRRALADRATQLVVSTVTAFELATKYRIGKLPEAHSVVLGYSDTLDGIGATELPISSRHGLVAGQLDWAHRDPFDRMLAAQSMVESLPLVTVDPSFATIGGVATYWE